MVFTGAFYASSTTSGVNASAEEREARKKAPPPPREPVVDFTPVPLIKYVASDRSDWLKYTLTNAPYIGLAGLATGAQEAFYTFERMPDPVARRSFAQAARVFGIVGKKYAFATGLGALFCATEALVEESRRKHDFVSGIVAGAVTGLAFGATRPWPQPLGWPITFALMAVTADVLCETMPSLMGGFKFYGPLPNRPNWNDPAPPRPPIMDTGASARPTDSGHFWRGQ